MRKIEATRTEMRKIEEIKMTTKKIEEMVTKETEEILLVVDSHLHLVLKAKGCQTDSLFFCIN